jgi:hypothetical protein
MSGGCTPGGTRDFFKGTVLEQEAEKVLAEDASQK